MKESSWIKLLLFNLVCLVFPGILFAQQDHSIDSLINVLKSQKEDSVKAKTFIALTKRFLQLNQLEQAKKYAGQGISLAKSISYKRGEISIFYNLGIIYSREYNFNEALKAFTMSLTTSQESGDKNLAANAFTGIANTHFNQGEYDKALRNHSEALKIKQELGDKQGLIMCYNNIGLVNWNSGNYQQAYKYYRAGLKIRQEIGDQLGIAHSYNVLGVIYDDEGNYPEALTNYISSLKIYEKLGAGFGIASTNNNIGELYRKQNNFQEALKRFRSVLEYYEKVEDKGGIAGTYQNMGIVHAMQLNYREAQKNFSLSLEFSREINDKYGIGSAYGNMAILAYKEAGIQPDQSKKQHLLSEAFKNSLESVKIFEGISQKDGVAKGYIVAGMVNTELKEFEEARKHINDGLRLSIETGVKETIKNGYEALAKLDSATGNWEGAYLNHQKVISYRDTLQNLENTSKILKLQMQYDFDKKENALKFEQELMREKLKQQTLLSLQQKQAITLHEQEFEIISNEKQFQQLQLEKEKADYAAQKAETKNKQGQIALLTNEKALQTLELNKQKQLKYYFIIGIILISILSLFVYNYYRTRQKLKLQLLRNKIASDLHDDVGSTLSSISIFSQMAQQQSSEVIPLLETIEENSRSMLDAMADIVWTINPENDQFEKIILRMRSFAFELLGAKNIDFEFIADDKISKIDVSMEVRKNLYLIFKEATNNLVKYSAADKVIFILKNEAKDLTMLIKDNGKGFDIHNSKKGNGLINMKKRAEEIGALLFIDSHPGSGTSIQLKMTI